MPINCNLLKLNILSFY